MKGLKRLAAWAFLTLGLAACAQTGTSAPTLRPINELGGSPPATFPPVPTLDPEQIALGSEVYRLHCAVCHGANLEGAPDWQTPKEDGSFRAPPHDASGHTWHHSDGNLIDRIRFGAAGLHEEFRNSSNMPAFEEVLADEEIFAVLAFIKSTWPAETRQYQWEATLVMDGP